MDQKHTATFWQGRLARGLYVAEIPDAGIRHGFQVTGAGPLELHLGDAGPQVRPPHPTELYSIDVEAKNAAATISVLDHNLNRIFSDTGELHEFDAPGVYKIRIELGRDISSVTEEVVLLDGNLAAASAAPAVSSPAPIPGSAMIHETHVEPFVKAAAREGRVPAGPAGATLSVLARYWLEPDKPRGVLGHPMEGLELVSPSGDVVAGLLEDSELQQGAPNDPVAVWERRLEPGPYFLRHTFHSGRTGEATMMACPGWVTQIALQRSPALLVPGVGEDDIVPIVDAALFMRPAEGSAKPPTEASKEDQVIETARLALAQGRDLLGKPHGSGLRKLLLEDYEDPIAGIIGSYLLLVAMETAQGGTEIQHEQLDAAVVRLRGKVGGFHPDIAALSLRCSDPGLRWKEPFPVPPIFKYGWKLLTQASYANPALIPDALWQRVHAVTNFGPFLTWAADPGAKLLHARQLARWVRDNAPQEDEEAAQRMLIPASAAAAIIKGHRV